MNEPLQKEMEWLVRGYYHRCRSYRQALQQIDARYHGDRRQIAQALLLFLPEMQKMQAVDKALQKTDPIVANALLRNIIDRIPPCQLDCPMGRRQFYRERRRFLTCVAQNLGCI